MFRRKPRNTQEKGYTTDEHATAIAGGLKDVLRQGDVPPEQFKGLLPIVLGGKKWNVDLGKYVDDCDKSTVLVMAGVLLAEQGLIVDISLVADERDDRTGTVTKTSIVVTPENVEPPQERNVIYPPDAENQRPSTPFTRLAPRDETTIGGLIISTDIGDRVRATSLGLL